MPQQVQAQVGGYNLLFPENETNGFRTVIYFVREGNK